MRIVESDDLSEMALGAAVLGTGGGGDPYLGRLLAQQCLAEHGPVDLVRVDSVPDDALVLPIAMMGAPTVMVEKLPGTAELPTVVRMLQKRLGRSATHIVPMEVGGINSMLPIAAAAQLRLPLVDADGMGRAFPELQMTLPSLGGVSVTPAALSDEKGNGVVLDTVDNHWTERLARSITVTMGGSSVVSLYPLDGRSARETLVAGSLSWCGRIGAEVTAARTRHADPVDAVLGVIGGRRVFTGKVLDVESRTSAGFARGTAVLAGSGADGQSRAELTFQNEHLHVVVDGVTCGIVPDLVCVLDAETAAPVTTEALRYGLRVVVVTAPCDPRWHTQEGLALVGPDVFGLQDTPEDPTAAEPRAGTG